MDYFQALDGHNPVIDGEFIRNYGFDWTNRTHLHIEGFEIKNHVAMGIGNTRPGKMIVRRNILHGNGSAGIAMNFNGTGAAHGVPSQLIIEDNIVHTNGWGEGWASGIHVNNKGEGIGAHHIIRRNLCYNNYDGSDFHTDGNGIMFDIGGAGSFALIENNICYNNGGRGISVKWGQAIVQNNVCYRNGWDLDFEYKAPEIAIIGGATPAIANHEQANLETSSSIVRNNVMVMRPRRNGWGQCFEAIAVDTSLMTVSNNLFWADIPEEAAAGLYSWMTNSLVCPPHFKSPPIDNTLEDFNGGLRMIMGASDDDFTLLPGSQAIDYGTLRNLSMI